MTLMFSAIEALRGVIDPSPRHPERDQFSHTVQVTLLAASETDDSELIAAAALHDIGKAIALHGHEHESARMAKPFVSERTHWLIRHHLSLVYLLNGQMSAKKAERYYQNPWFVDLVRLRRWDQAGRDPAFVVDDRATETFRKVLTRNGLGGS